jgi:hypothetical protein
MQAREDGFASLSLEFEVLKIAYRLFERIGAKINLAWDCFE